jgi:hypothetical protein
MTQSEFRKYVRLSRKTKTKPMTFVTYNKKFNATLPVSEAADVAYSKFIKSWNNAKRRDGFPITGRLFNIEKELTVASVLKTSLNINPQHIPCPSRSIKPMKARTKKMTSSPPRKKVKKEYSLEDYKIDLLSWLKENNTSKLNHETQNVYFVPSEKIENFEHFSTKLTRSTGKKLKSGGEFKMRSGKKQIINNVNQEDVANVISSVTAGEKGPFFVRIS